MLRTIATKIAILVVLISTTAFAQNKINAATQLTNSVPIANGGVGQAFTYSKGDILCAISSSSLMRLPVGSNTQVLTADSTQTCGVKWANATGGTQPYIISLYVPGPQTNSQTFVVHTPPLAVSVASGCTNSVLALDVAATGSTTYTLKKNGSSVGTAVVSASGTTGTFTCASSFSFNGTTDYFSITGPATADTTAAGLRVSIYGTR